MPRIDDVGPAFPHSTPDEDFAGMSLRDYFAGKAINGLTSNQSAWNASKNDEELARQSYLLADALLAARDAATPATRANLIAVLAAMPEEAFGYFVAWAGGMTLQYPDGLGGFQQASQDSIKQLRAQAKAYNAAQNGKK